MIDDSILDLSQPTVEIALDLIYQANAYRLPSYRIKFGRPQVLDIIPSDPRDENTFVPAHIDERYDWRFDNISGFLYRRIPMSLLKADESVPIELPDFPFETYDVLPQINEALHTQLTEDDVINEKFYFLSGPLKVKAHPWSLVWLGETQVTPFNSTNFIPRLTEEASWRVTEDGTVRIMEDQ